MTVVLPIDYVIANGGALVIVAAVPVSSVTAGGSRPGRQHGTWLRSGILEPAPVITGAMGAYCQTRTATWSYTASTSLVHAVSAPGTVLANTAPVVPLNPVLVTTNADTSVSITIPAREADGNSLTYTATGNPGTLSGTDATRLCAPNANSSGSDSFTVGVSDGTAAVSITSTPLNGATVARADSYATDEDTPLVVVVPGILASDGPTADRKAPSSEPPRLATGPTQPPVPSATKAAVTPVTPTITPMPAPTWPPRR